MTAASTIDRARADLAGRTYFLRLTPGEQEQAVAALARQLAIFDSPIGRAAAKVSRAADTFAAAIDDFLASFPDEEAAIAACRAADPERADHFAATPELLRGVETMLDLVLPDLDHCAPPELAQSYP
jgi:hypothetical protein